MLVSDRIQCRRINKFFYETPQGEILKYSRYCIEKIAEH